MSLKNCFIWLSASFILLTTAMAFIFGCSSNDKSTSPVEFTYPHTYTGTYKAVENWMTADSIWTYCNATFIFAKDHIFTIVIDTASCEGDFNPCSAQGNYSFSGDSLFIEITNENYRSELCSVEYGSAYTGYRYIIDGDYIVFESRGNKYRKIEFKGR
ncbi:MAG: hypothetical protein CVT49_04720 [candidate division Zixibacteria bacterium HGW-Zixibacteria-1]|nr:MAG: hypothetical protein CVT49_04720 [candidate division Zixibacteria bacterium HGW-Zixibacteria-1]